MVKTEIKKCEICGVDITGYGKPHMERNYEAHMTNEHPKKVIVIEANIDDILEEEEEEEIVLEDMTKDELNDFAVEIGYKKEIKAHWKKSKIISTLKGLFKKNA